MLTIAVIIGTYFSVSIVLGIVAGKAMKCPEAPPVPLTLDRDAAPVPLTLDWDSQPWRGDDIVAPRESTASSGPSRLAPATA